MLLHGFASNKEVWLKVAKLLTPHFHLIIPDLPGWGESSRMTEASYDIDAQATRLDGFVQTLGLQQFVLVGHSMGGAIAGVYAAEHPEHVAELALVDAFGLKADDNAFSREIDAPARTRSSSTTAPASRAPAPWRSTSRWICPGALSTCWSSATSATSAFIERTFHELRSPSQYLSLQHRLGQLSMPVLGLWCHDDKIVDISALDSLRNGLTASSAISTSMLNGCNHMPMLEKPEQTAQVLTGFALSH